MMTDGLEELLNQLNDIDHGWWPFLFMRPEPDERMTTVRVAGLAALYGLLPGFFVSAVVRITGEHADSLHPLFFPLAVTLAFFTVFRFTFAASWNRRAARFARRVDRS